MRDKAFEAQELRHEALYGMIALIVKLLRHNKQYKFKEQIEAGCALEREVCEAARKLIAADDTYMQEALMTCPDTPETLN